MMVDDIELILLRSIVERKETCRQAAEAVVHHLLAAESQKRYAHDEKMGRTI